MLIPVRSERAFATGLRPAVRALSVPSELWVVAGLTVLAASLRFATLGAQSYWFDEAQAAHELHLSFGSMLSSMTAHETNPPLYFLLGWVWAKVFGTSEVGLRSLSALAGTAVVPITFLCGRELVSARAGIVAAALAAVNPFMIWYSQEAREYMLLALLCGASLLCFARAQREPSPRNLAWWAVFSALALLTHFFAGFLVAPEAIWLLYRARSRASVIAAGSLAVVQLALLPFLSTHASGSLLGFIRATPLSMRIQQVPVAFGLGTLYQSSIVSYGLLAAAVLVAALIALLVIGADSDQLSGAGLAAAIAAVVLLVPLLVALLGGDYYAARALMPAWVPLAVLIGAACTAPATRAPGAALAAVLLGAFVYGQIKIDHTPQYQRPDWRAVASSLGGVRGARALVVYEGGLATDPLKLYVPGVPWNQPAAATVREVDVIGSTWQAPPSSLPAGTRLIGRRVVDDFLVDRFSVTPPWRLSLAAIGARAGALLPPAPASPAVLVQNPGAPS